LYVTAAMPWGIRLSMGQAAHPVDMCLVLGSPPGRLPGR
jgi:hypothetical protein